MSSPRSLRPRPLPRPPSLPRPPPLLLPPPLPLLLLLLLLLPPPPRAAGPAAAAGQLAVSCDEFLQMKVLEEVKAIAQGRVPRECRDRKLEHQRQDQRRRAAAQRGRSAGPSGAQYDEVAAQMKPLRELLRGWPLTRLERPSDYHLPIPSLCVAAAARPASAYRLATRAVPGLITTGADYRTTAWPVAATSAQRLWPPSVW
jgi:hypothetical protein